MLIGHDRERGVANADLMLDRQGFLAAAIERSGELAAIVRIDSYRLPRAAYRHVKLLPIDELGREPRVDVDDDAIDGRTLRRMRSRRIAMISWFS
jgi:hypothetical protein